MKVKVVTKSGNIFTQDAVSGTYEEYVENFRLWLLDGEMRVIVFDTEEDTFLIPAANIETIQVINEEE
ncbi:hypothetical protein [Listeria seeligeri]|uniref:hypothetical protein n=1 Tax=Listeria seeligeri TaxID=1640 RepID=UPI0016245BC9|nr:hypothetical protein [Listeria seeligeri]MBC1851179.1 hypothetical protein [Listeria seeligeri]MBC1929337.1 hypothetical protein [Listeria seeligeri]MBF2370275.1 hypothetical protein [Listeria seeligeri]MBF2390473.1 hypothetical protein [Listeria seeligeri]